MWVEKDRSWIKMVLLAGFALPHIWGRTLAVTAISIVVMVLYETVPQLHYSITTIPFTIIGLPLGVFLGFRNNSAYDRFWEGRKLWGGLVNTSRSLARQFLTLVQSPERVLPARPPDQETDAPKTAETRAFQNSAVRLIVAYVHALRHHLRDTDPKETLSSLLPSTEADRVGTCDNVPLMLLQQLGEQVADAHRRRWIHTLHVPIFEASLVALTDIQGGCERIKSTRLPILIPCSYTASSRCIARFSPSV